MKFWVLLVVVICSFFWLDLSAQDSLKLEEIIIQDKRLASSWREAVRPVQILGRQDILTAPVSSFEELLSFVAGLDIQQKGVHGIQADLNIRGGTFEQALVLVNGVRMNDIQTGHHNLNIPLAPIAVERIEVVKGPASRRYGQNAYAGAVNIITREPQKDHLTMQAEYGEFDTYAIGGLLELAREQSSHLIHARTASSDGYRFNTDYKKHNIWYQNVTKTSFGRLRFQGGYTKKDFGANGFYASPDFQDQYEEVETSLVSAEAEILKAKWDINPRLYWRRNQDEYLFLREDPSFLRNLHTSNQLGLEVNANYADALGGTGIGIDLRQESLESNNLGNRDRSLMSFFVEKNLILLDQKLHVTPGFTWSYFSDFGSFFFPGIDVGYRLGEASTVFANVGQTYRVPSFTDLYYSDPANEGNPDLTPEQALSYELGYRFLKGNSSLTSSVFLRDTDDLIDWTKSAESDPWKPSNISELSTYGAEFQYDRWFASKWVQRLGVGYTYIQNSEVENDANFSRYALENLEHQVVLHLKHSIVPGRLTHHLVYRFTDRVTLDSYHLVDSRLEFEYQEVQAFLMINNLLDQEYRESNLVPMPGRWIRAGVNLGIDLE